MTMPRAAQLSTLAGMAPFIVLAVAAGAGDLRAMGLGALYGGLVLAFLGGVRWGAVTGPVDSRRQATTMAVSAVPVAVALLAFSLATPIALAVLVSAYLVSALWDVLSVERGELPPWFGLARMALTAGAVLSLLAILVTALI